MSTIQELKDAVATAKAALDAAADETKAARSEVEQALAAVNSSITDRVRSRDGATQIPIARLKRALDDLTAVEAKYAISPDDGTEPG